MVISGPRGPGDSIWCMDTGFTSAICSVSMEYAEEQRVCIRTCHRSESVSTNLWADLFAPIASKEKMLSDDLIMRLYLAICVG